MTLWALAGLTLLVHFLTNGGYGYFRDELYYLACGRHLAFGYVDHPPFIALVAALTRATLGQSLFALRFFPALAHAALVWVTGAIARELGGDARAQALAGIAALVAPVYLGASTILNMNPFEQLFWALASLVLIVLIERDRPRLWLAFGLVAGISLMTKHSTGLFLAAVTIGLLLGPERRRLANRWAWLGASIAILVFLPNVIWEIRHGWPTLEFLHNATAMKNVVSSPLQFLAAQVLLEHPASLPLWLAGLGFFFVARRAAKLRCFGWTYVVLFGLVIATHGKHYYLAPIYPVLLAGGAVAFSALVARRWRAAVPVYAGFLLVAGAALAPYVLPILPPEAFIRYARALHIQEPASERHRAARLPQTFADMFGWEEMVGAVARVYRSLTPEERSRCLIFASNYGEAGAVDFFGPKYGLPRASSGHNSYFLWGPANPDADIVITVGESVEDVGKSFEDVRVAARFSHDYNMPYESDLPIIVGRRIKRPLGEIWPQTKKYI